MPKISKIKSETTFLRRKQIPLQKLYFCASLDLELQQKSKHQSLCMEKFSYPYYFPYMHPFNFSNQMGLFYFQPQQPHQPPIQFEKYPAREGVIQKQGSNAVELQKQIETNKKLVKVQTKEKAKSKKNIFSNQGQDDDFIRKEQTQGRNLTSNTLKLYLREVRTNNSLPFLSLEEIIFEEKVSWSVKEFIKILNKHLPAKKNYISLVEVKELVEGKKGGRIFGRILKKSITNFYENQIDKLEIKSVRTSKDVRNQQIKRGEEIVMELEFIDL